MKSKKVRCNDCWLMVDDTSVLIAGNDMVKVCKDCLAKRRKTPQGQYMQEIEVSNITIRK